MFGKRYINTEAWYTGVVIAADAPAFFPVAIGSHSYMVEPSKYQRRTIPTLRPATDTQPEPGEVSLSNAGFWRRSQSDWRAGAGQVMFDEADSQRNRYFASKGLNPHPDQPLNRYTLRMLPDTRRILASAATNSTLISVNGFLYVVDGAELRFTTNPSLPAPVWSTSGMSVATGGQTVLSIATDGAYIYAALGAGGVYKTAIGTTNSLNALFAPHTVAAVVYGNGRLLCLNGANINEIDAAGHYNGEATVTGLLAYTAPNPAMVFSAGTPSPHGIFVAANAGDRAEAYRVGVDSSSGALQAPTSVFVLPDGETLNSMVYYAGSMVVATSRGIRVASVTIVLTNIVLAYGPVTLIPGGVTNVAGQGEFVWFTWTNYDTVSTGLGRLALATFAVPLVPAYSSDLMAGTALAPVQGAITGLCSFGGRRYFSIAGQGVWAEHPTNYVAAATLNCGRVKFGTTEQKIISSMELYCDPLPAGGSIQPSLLDELGNTTQVQSFTQTGGVHSGLLAVPTTNPAEQITPQFAFTCGTDPTTAPLLRRWTLRALVTPRRNDEIIVPIILTDTVTAPVGEGISKAQDPLMEFQYLKSLEASGQIVRYQEGDASWDVYVDQIELQPTRWSANHHRNLEGLCLVRMVTVDANH